MNNADVVQAITDLAEQPFDLAEFLYVRGSPRRKS
jgi:hypothetical protein